MLSQPRTLIMSSQFYRGGRSSGRGTFGRGHRNGGPRDFNKSSSRSRTQRDFENANVSDEAGMAHGTAMRKGPKPPPPTKLEVPKPKHLSTHASEYNNEPPFEGSYDMAGYSGVMQVGGVAKFTTSATALGDISDVLYDQLCAADRTFSKTVSRSMLEYYITQIYYMRISQIELSNGIDDIETRMMAEQGDKAKWVIPRLFADYLNCIGNFKDSTGMVDEHMETIKPSNIEYNGVKGYFGRVTANTHYHYENRPAPGVIAQRICEDLRYSLNGELGQMWNLPVFLRPEEEDAGGPTANLIGWMPAIRLTHEQQDGLLACGINIEDDVNVFPSQWKFCFSNNLMEYVDRRLNELSGRIKCELGMSKSYNGSLCQQDYTRIIPDQNQQPLITCSYGKNSVKLEAFAKIDIRQNLFSQSMRFRYYKEGIDDAAGNPLDSWNCYGFNNYHNVPDEWSQTKNFYFDYGEREAWNIGRFASAGICPRQSQNNE